MLENPQYFSRLWVYIIDYLLDGKVEKYIVHFRESDEAVTVSFHHP